MTKCAGLMEATGVLDLLGLSYTGSGPGALYLQEDKALTKKVLAYEELKCPDFAVFSPESDLETGGNLRLPLFVKPLRMDSSVGIDGSKSLVRNTMELMEQVAHIHKELKDSALCEEYIDGREFYVGILGNQDPIAFPPIEIDFTDMPEDAPKVLDAKAKFDESTPEFKGTKPVVAEIDDQLRARLHQVALTAYRALVSVIMPAWISGWRRPARSTSSKSTPTAISKRRASLPCRPRLRESSIRS